MSSALDKNDEREKREGERTESLTLTHDSFFTLTRRSRTIGLDRPNVYCTPYICLPRLQGQAETSQCLIRTEYIRLSRFAWFLCIVKKKYFPLNQFDACQ